MSTNDRIVIDPAVCHGRPVIRGTRTPATFIIGGLAGGMTREEIQREYDVTAEDVTAALVFAAHLMEEEQHHLLPAG